MMSKQSPEDFNDFECASRLAPDIGEDLKKTACQDCQIACDCGMHFCSEACHAHHRPKCKKNNTTRGSLYRTKAKVVVFRIVEDPKDGDVHFEKIRPVDDYNSKSK